MRGKYLLLLFFVFTPCMVWGACSDHDDNQELCIKQAGCQYKPATDVVSSKCILCDEDRYCPNNAICSDGLTSSDGSCPCPERFPFSMEGTASIDDCYAPCASSSDNYEQHTQHCGMTYRNFGTHNISCLINGQLTSGTIDSQYHIEITSDNIFGCYLNDRECNRFNAIDYNSNELTGTLEGTATWEPHYNDDNGGYSVNNCRYKSTNEQSASKHCARTVFYSPRNDNQHVSNAQEAIQFYTGDSYTTDADSNYYYYYYYCTSCEDGPYYPTNANATNCIPPNDHESSDTTYYMACSCEQIPQGYYRRTQWNYEQPVNSNPLDTYYTACPAGKTTLNNIGGMSIGDCTYTRDTKFCDANGCFKITDADSWNWSD